MDTSDSAVRQVWHSFCDELTERMKTAGNQVIKEATNTLDRDEGLRVIIRDIRYSLERDIEELDVYHPVFSQMTRDLHHLLIDTPDYGVFDAKISGELTYKMAGQLGSADDIMIMVMGDDPTPPPVVDGADVGETFGPLSGTKPRRPRHMTAVITGSELVTDEDGRFEILLAPEPPGSGNWLRTDPATDIVIVRNIYHGNYHEHRRHWPARLWIEAIGAPARPAPYRTEDLYAGIANVLAGAGTISTSRSDISRRIANVVVNGFSDDDRYWKRTGANPVTKFHEGYWELEPGTSMIIELPKLPKTSFWSLGLGDYWMESLDFRFRPVNINSNSVTYGPDGAVRIVVSNEDPGVPNWLDADGHTRGVILWRWNQPESVPDVARTIVVPTSHVCNHPSLYPELASAEHPSSTN